jgi:hypothetical protein
VLTAVSAVPTVQPVPAVLVVPVVPEIGAVATDPASPTIATVPGGAEDQHGRRHPPQGVEEAEAEQDHDENKNQNEHGGLLGAERNIAAGGRGLYTERSPPQRLRTAPHVSVLYRDRMATCRLSKARGEG